MSIGSFLLFILITFVMSAIIIAFIVWILVLGYIGYRVGTGILNKLFGDIL